MCQSVALSGKPWIRLSFHGLPLTTVMPIFQDKSKHESVFLPQRTSDSRGHFFRKTKQNMIYWNFLAPVFFSYFLKYYIQQRPLFFGFYRNSVSPSGPLFSSSWGVDFCLCPPHQHCSSLSATITGFVYTLLFYIAKQNCSELRSLRSTVWSWKTLAIFWFGRSW